MAHLRGQRAPHLGDLDNFLLLHCFSYLTPLPDIFNVAASCRRFRDLALDRRSWLYVTHSAAAAADGDAAQPAAGAAGAGSGTQGLTSQEQQRRQQKQHQQQGPSALASPAAAAAASAAGGGDGDGAAEGAHWYRSRFATLEAAVAASRPGDTILLEASPVPHRITSTVVVTHPLHILGAGGASSSSGDGSGGEESVGSGCVLEGVRGLEALVDFRSSGRLANLTLKATAGACVAHTRGRLTIQGCTLECDARGLPHLAAPLLTRAVCLPLPLPLPLPPVPPHMLPAASASGAARPPPAMGVAMQTASASQALPHLNSVLPGSGNTSGSSRLKKRPADGSPANEPGSVIPLPVPDGAAAAAVATVEPPGCKRQRSSVQGTRLVAGAAAAVAGVGAGVLSVAETRIKARGSAVDLRGSGRLSSVRVIYSAEHALVWLEVDSANGGSSGGSSSSSSGGSSGLGTVVPPATPAAGVGADAGAHPPPPAAAAEVLSASGGFPVATVQGQAGMALATVPATPLPSWAGRAAAAGFDAAAFQLKAQQLVAPPAHPTQQAQQQAQQAGRQLQEPQQEQLLLAAPAAAGPSIAQKAEEWCLHHHTSLAAAPHEVAVGGAPPQDTK